MFFQKISVTFVKMFIISHYKSIVTEKNRFVNIFVLIFCVIYSVYTSKTTAWRKAIDIGGGL